MTARINTLAEQLSQLPTTHNLFNPYDPADEPSSSIRRNNLIQYLHDMKRFAPKTILVFEAPGYRGCRLTGIPVTSERIMLKGIDQWELFGEKYQGTSGQQNGVAEMTATILWNALVEHTDSPPLIWNTVPLHPHKPGKPQSNRTPLVSEIRMGQPFIADVIEIFGIEQILGVGRKAQRALGELGYECLPLRHPSQGGKVDFIAGLRSALG